MLNLINSGQSWRNMIDKGVQGKCNKLGKILQGPFVWNLLGISLSSGKKDALFFFFRYTEHTFCMRVL